MTEIDDLDNAPVAPDPRDAFRAVDHRLRNTAARLVAGDDQQHDRFAQLIRARGSAIRAVRLDRHGRLAEEVENSPDAARALAEQILRR